MFCPRCATENQLEQKFCRHCGQSLAGVRLTLEGRVDEAIEKLQKGKLSRRSLIFLSIFFAFYFLAMLRALASGEFGVKIGIGLGVGLSLTIPLIRKLVRLWRVERALIATSKTQDLRSGQPGETGLPAASAAGLSVSPASVTEHTTLELKTPRQVEPKQYNYEP